MIMFVCVCTCLSFGSIFHIWEKTFSFAFWSLAYFTQHDALPLHPFTFKPHMRHSLFDKLWSDFQFYRIKNIPIIDILAKFILQDVFAEVFPRVLPNYACVLVALIPRGSFLEASFQACCYKVCILASHFSVSF
jgi:hypothetical protein